MTFNHPSRPRVAIIDLGTNTFHLLVAELAEAGPVLLHREKQPVKIGMGGINQRVITTEAIERGVKCLLHFREVMEEWKVGRIIAIGTSALRSAANGESVIKRMKQETDIDIKLISGEQEATYIYQGVRSALDLGTQPALIVDIGGGSVEFIIGNQSAILWKESVETGAQRLLERYQRHDPILPEEIAALNTHFDHTLQGVKTAVNQFKPEVLVGSSGTFDTLSDIHCLRQGMPLTQATETPLTPESFHETHRLLTTLDRAQRMRIPGMIEMRVDMIVVASCLVKYLLDQFGFRKIRVSTYSLKEGVLSLASVENGEARL